MSHNMTQEELDLKIKYMAKYEEEVLKKIKVVRQQTLKKFLLYFCTSFDRKPLNVFSRRALYDYKLAKEIIMEYLNFVEKLTDPFFLARMELEKLEKEKQKE